MPAPAQNLRSKSFQTVDILVSGGGIAGLITAAAFGACGFSVLIVDPVPPVADGADMRADLRSTAFLRPARDLFERIGIWPNLAPHATPLEALRIVDTVGRPSEIRDQRVFEGRETADEPFGWNFLNWVMRRELLKILPTIDSVEARFGTAVTSLFTRTGEARVGLSDGTRVKAKLAIAADGRNSALRDMAGIGVKTTHYGQKSLAFTAIHDVPHGNVSTEIYREGGPFTLVPLHDIDGQPASAVVWMNKNAYAQELHSLPETEFNAVMTERAARLYGEMKLASKRGIFPIITQTANALASERVAILAEAAHVLPPIGAQGLNTSLNDLILLLDLCQENATDPGDWALLETYAKQRHRDIKTRAKAVDLFNRVTRSEGQILQGLRLEGLKAAYDIAPLRRGLMRAGLGPL